MSGSKTKITEPKEYRVFFDISAIAYRDVMAYDEEDAMEQVDQTKVEPEDFENADFGTVMVDDVIILSAKEKKKKSKK